MSRQHNLTYNEIIADFKIAANLHLGISDFETGTLDYLDAYAANKNYPLLYLRPLSSGGVVDRVRSLTFEMYVIDVPKLQDESPVNVVSKTEMMVYDILSYFNFGPENIQQKYEVVLTSLVPVNEGFQDRAYGWVATIEVNTMFRLDYCDYPQFPTASAPYQPVTPDRPVTRSLGEIFPFYLNLTGSINPSASCASTGSDSGSFELKYYRSSNDLGFPCDLEAGFIYNDISASITYTASLESGSYFAFQSSESYAAQVISASAFSGSHTLESIHLYESASAFYVHRIFECPNYEHVCLQ